MRNHSQKSNACGMCYTCERGERCAYRAKRFYEDSHDKGISDPFLKGIILNLESEDNGEESLS